MSRYNNHSGSGTGNGNNSEYDDTILKLQKYSTLRGVFTGVDMTNTDYGDKFKANLEEVAVLDGVVFQRDDKPGTWKVFSPAKFFELGEDGRVYKTHDPSSGEFSDEMSAQDILDHPRVQGFSESFGDNDYWYTPVGVVIEAADDIAVNEDLIEVPDETAIPVGDATMFLSNKSWVRTLGKLLTPLGHDLILTEVNDEGDEVPVSDRFDWTSTMDVDLREGLDGRMVEMFLIEESATFNGNETTWTTPVLLDEKTSSRITLDNLADGDVTGDTEATSEPEPEPEPAPATDGGAVPAESDSSTETTQSPETTESPETAGDVAETDGLPADVPAVLDDLIGYFARTQNGDVSPDDLREFAADEVDDPDAVDWDAAAAEAERRA